MPTPPAPDRLACRALTNGLALDLGRLRALVADVPDADLARQPDGCPNHAAWTLGHLAHSLEAIGGEMGLAPWLPADFAPRFGTGSAPSPDRAAYPTKPELLAHLDDGAARIEAALGRLSLAELAQDLPDERHRATYPTLLHAMTHVLGSHLSFHVGQLSCWRRAL